MNARAQRVLLVTVIALGILLVIGFAIVVATIAARVAGGGEEDAPAPAVALLSGGEIPVALPAGYRVVSVTGEERRLVLHLAGPQGAPGALPDRVIVLDARTGQVVRSLVLAPGGP